MNNKKLIEKVTELATQTLHTREQSHRVMVQIAIIRNAYGIKIDEHETESLDFERERILSDQEINKEFEMYLSFWEWAIRINDQDKAKQFENQMYYFIDGVRFFDEGLAESFA